MPAPRTLDGLLQELNVLSKQSKEKEVEEVILDHYWGRFFLQYLNKRNLKTSIAALK